MKAGNGVQCKNLVIEGFIAAPKEIIRLVELFERNLADYRSGKSYETQLQRQITDTDKQIDALVYELYGLTEEEIGIVEAGV